MTGNEIQIKVDYRKDYCFFEEIQNNNSTQTGIQDPSSSVSTENTKQLKKSVRKRKSCVYWGYSDYDHIVDRGRGRYRGRGREGEEVLEFDAREGKTVKIIHHDMTKRKYAKL